MPIENILSYKLICKGGLESNRNILDLSDNYPGFATTLQNFEPSLFGGYRRMEGYAALESAFPEVTNTGSGGGASGKVLGVFIYNGNIYAARADALNAFWYLNRWNPGADWSVVMTMPARPITAGGQTVNKIRYATFNFNGTEKIILVDGVSNALIWDGTNWGSVSPGGSGANLANAGGAQALSNPKYVTVFRNHIFVSGDSASPHIVAHSAPNTDYDWVAANGAGQVIAGFAVQQIKPFREANYVFGFNKIKKIEVDSSSFVINDVVQNTGCIASDSVVEINGDLLYLSQDGFRNIAATERIGDIELGNLSRNIQQDIITLVNTQSDMTQVDAVVVRSKSQYRLFFNDSTINATDTHGIITGLKGDMTGAVRWEWGRTKGIRTCVATSDYIGRTEYILHGDYNGKVYKQENGNSFDTRNIHAVYSTPFLDFGDTQIRKTFRNINIFLRPEGSVTLDAAISLDWDNYGIINPSSYTISSVGTPPTWGSFNWGAANYGNSGTIPVNTTPISGTGFAIEIEFSTDDISAPYTIQGVVIEYSVDGRK